MENKFLVAVLTTTLGLGLSARAEEKLGLLKDSAAMEAATSDLGEPEVTVEYQIVDADGNTKTQGTAEVQKDPKKKDEVVVVVKNPDGTLKEVRRDKKIMTPTQWGEGLSWWDIGYGMVAGHMGEEALKVSSEGGSIPAGNLHGRQTQYHSQAGGAWTVSAAVRPRILQQRVTLGFDINPTGCDGAMNYLAPTDVDMHSGLSCHALFSKYVNFAFLRKGTEGSINEFAIGVAEVNYKVDHNVPTGASDPMQTSKQGTNTVLTTKHSFLAPKFTYRFWTNSFVHPQLDVTVGKNVFFVNFTARFSAKKKVREINQKANGGPQ